MASETLRADLLNDIRDFNKTHNGISRRLYRKHGTYSERQLRNHFGSFGNALREAGITKPATSPQPNKPNNQSQGHTAGIAETNEVFGNTWNVTLPQTRISTLEELLSYCKVDTSIWRVERFVVNKWEVGAKDDSGKIAVEPLFQVKATLVKNPDLEAAAKEIERLKEEAKNFAPFPRMVVRPINNSGNVLEINIPDPHLGKLAWSKETGYENYDTPIAEATYCRALENLVQRASNYSFDRVLFVVGNDLLHSDDLDGRTTKGTYVNTDGRYQKTFVIARKMIVRCIERLREIAPVKVLVVPGNHDTRATWHLGDSLECYFHRYDDVEIDNNPTPRKYFQHGNVMLMFTHGDKGKRTDYPLLMATEQRAMWGATKYRETHTGHTHMTKMDEQHGIRVRVLPALCPPDAWHSENGFVGNLRSAEGYVWNNVEGLVTQVFYNDDAFEPIETKVTIAA